MIAGRLRWKERGAKVPGRLGLAAFDFPMGTLVLTETGSKKCAALRRENYTLDRDRTVSSNRRTRSAGERSTHAAWGRISHSRPVGRQARVTF